MEWFFLFVDVFVTGEQISPVRRIRTGGATVAFAGGSSDGCGTEVGFVFIIPSLWNVQSTNGAHGPGRRTVLWFDFGLFEWLLWRI